MDNASVTILNTGEVFSFYSCMFGKISADDMPELDREKITQAVEKKLDAIYQDVRGNYAAVKYEKPIFSLTLLDDGTPVLYGGVGIQFEDRKGGHTSDALKFVVTLKP